MQTVDAIIVGGGPCGLSAAIELQKIGLKPVVIEKGNVVNALYNYPTHQTFFSTSEKLAIGDVPFIIEERKPRRNQALVYYREVVKMKNIQVNRFEKVESVLKEQDGIFTVRTDKAIYSTPYVIVATGYYDQPNYMNIVGEDLPKVYHYFKEAHPFFDTDVLVIGGKNSAVDAALELNKAGARVTVVYRGSDYSPSIKPWILPEFTGLVRNEEITMHFNTHVKEIREQEVVIDINGEITTLKNDFVFAMTGYHPDHGFIRAMGVTTDEASGRPTYDPETMETNVENLYIAGVLAAGNNANEIFIENGKFHGGFIAENILKKMK
ncbi:thioredoxin reductase (NADPH) [Ureibacillus xyleni]|uniref:Thioredoxin reductase (NADPH) n=1 Tax=Ureibacillus xyleni TaxID=614648 RepID=A0A285RJJ2_9BACL|nr:YpdA family putative bacillithiol disulfide reductase [Ureibacillus xyleni]SOB94271.1 thioredoxin reductase (NADPH) [Ureibacillus xyleni]